MQNNVLEAPRARRSVERALANRAAAYAAEVRRLLDAGSALIRATGRVDPRVAEIVREAGLSNQAFYRHFRSKDELLLAILDEGAQILLGDLEQRMARGATAGARVRLWLEAVVARALDPPGAGAARPRAIQQARLAERFPEEAAEAAALLTAPLRAALREAAAAGELPGVDPERDADALYHLAMGWAQGRLLGGGAAPAEDGAHVIDFALAGLARGIGPEPSGDSIGRWKPARRTASGTPRGDPPGDAG